MAHEAARREITLIRKRWTAAALTAAGLLCAGVALATPPSAGDPPTPPADIDNARARTAFADGLEALRASDWALAEARFRESLALVPRPSTRYNLAFVLFQQDRFDESFALLDDLLLSTASGADPTYREYAEVLAGRIRARLEAQKGPVVAKPDAPPAAAPSSKPRRQPVATESNISKPAPERDSGPSSWGPWVSIGVGGALLVAGTITGLAARRADRRFVNGCPTLTDCDPSLGKDRDDAIRLGRITDVLWISGATFVIGGVVWHVVAPPPQRNFAGTGPLMVTMTARY